MYVCVHAWRELSDDIDSYVLRMYVGRHCSNGYVCMESCMSYYDSGS